MKNSQQAGNTENNHRADSSRVSSYFHEASYSMDGRELATGLILFFIIGVIAGALGFAIISHLN